MRGYSAFHNGDKPGRARGLLLFWALCAVFLFLSVPSASASSARKPAAAPPPAPEKKEPLLSKEALWDKAVAAKRGEKWDEAAASYKEYFDRFQKEGRGEESLWEAAGAAKKQALREKEAPDWEAVRDFYRLYTTEYPESPRVPEAFFEVGLAHYRMRFYREALIYLKLFEDRYPDSQLLLDTLFWRGKTLSALERYEEAAALFRRVSEESAERNLVVAALVGLGDTQTAAKDFAGALVTFSSLMQKYPDYYLEDPALLHRMGVFYMNVGREREGRKYLFQFLNIAPDSPLQNDVLFELAESYHREQAEASAQKLYDKVIEVGKAHERAVRLALFRKAEFSDSPERKLKEWEKKADLADPAGDPPYAAVLDYHHDEPIAQDARFGLFQRYRARNSFELAEEKGKAFLRYGEPAADAAGAEKNRAGEILLYLVEQYLDRKEYEKAYQLYTTEYRYVEKYKNGRLQYLVGRALEAISLYDQAAVVYYRALALPLTEEDKVDLYSRRAEVYLAQKDFAAAERLLAHLRNIYEGKGAIAEFYYLSGRLREEEKRYPEAQEFYDKAVAVQGSLADKPQYGLGLLRLLFVQGRYLEMLQALDAYRKEGWLAADVLQEWYRRVGDVLRKQNEPGPTIDAYLAAVSENMPQEGATAQNIHLHLGDMYTTAGDVEKGRSHYQKALKGPDQLLQKIARERLNQADIDEVLPGLDTLLDNS